MEQAEVNRKMMFQVEESDEDMVTVNSETSEDEAQSNNTMKKQTKKSQFLSSIENAPPDQLLKTINIKKKVSQMNTRFNQLQRSLTRKKSTVWDAMKRAVEFFADRLESVEQIKGDQIKAINRQVTTLMAQQ